MTPLPTWINSVLIAFAPLFSNRVWQHTQILLIGAILAPGKRTITSVLRIMGLSSEKHYQNYHRVLNRAVWSNLAASRILLGLLLSAFVPTGPLILGLDDTIEHCATHTRCDAKEQRLQPKASTVIQSDQAKVTSSKPAAYGGSV